MRFKNIALVAVAWLVSLAGVALWAQSGDVRRAPTLVPTLTEGQPIGEVITGQNIGFLRVAGQSAPGMVVGKWMVKVDGVWLEAQPFMRVTR